MKVLSVFLIIILFSIGVIHFYWAFGGDFGLLESLPTGENGEPVIRPTKIDSTAVGIIFMIFWEK